MSEVFYVKDTLGNLVAAKYLQVSGSYVQDPNGGSAATVAVFDVNGNPIADANPSGYLIVPADYSLQSANAFASVVSSLITGNQDTGFLAALGAMFGGFYTGGSQDLQRTYNGGQDQTDVPAFQDAASWNLGYVAEQSGVGSTAAQLGGGAVNTIKSWLYSYIDTGGEYGNNPNNSISINAGAAYVDAQNGLPNQGTASAIEQAIASAPALGPAQNPVYDASGYDQNGYDSNGYNIFERDSQGNLNPNIPAQGATNTDVLSDNTLMTVQVGSDGSSTSTQNRPDGSIVIEQKNGTGVLTQESITNPDGTSKSIDLTNNDLDVAENSSDGSSQKIDYEPNSDGSSDLTQIAYDASGQVQSTGLLQVASDGSSVNQQTDFGDGQSVSQITGFDASGTQQNQQVITTDYEWEPALDTSGGYAGGLSSAILSTTYGPNNTITETFSDGGRLVLQSAQITDGTAYAGSGSQYDMPLANGGTATLTLQEDGSWELESTDQTNGSPINTQIDDLTVSVPTPMDSVSGQAANANLSDSDVNLAEDATATVAGGYNQIVNDAGGTISENGNDNSTSLGPTATAILNGTGEIVTAADGDANIELASSTTLNFTGSDSNISEEVDSSGGAVTIGTGTNDILNVVATTLNATGTNQSFTINGTGNNVMGGGSDENIAVSGSIGSDLSGATLSFATGAGSEIDLNGGSGTAVSDASGVTGGTVGVLSSGNTVDASGGSVWFGANGVSTVFDGDNETIYGGWSDDALNLSGTGNTVEINDGSVSFGDGSSFFNFGGSNDVIDDASGVTGGSFYLAYGTGDSANLTNGWVGLNGGETFALDGTNNFLQGYGSGSTVTIQGQTATNLTDGDIILADSSSEADLSGNDTTVTDASGVTGGTVGIDDSGNTANISDGTLSFGANGVSATLNGTGDVVTGSDSNDGVYLGDSGDTADFSNGWVNLATGSQNVLMNGTNNWLGTNGLAGDTATIDGQAWTDLSNGSLILDNASEVDLNGAVGSTVTDASGVTGGTVGIMTAGNIVDTTDGSVQFDGNDLNTTVDGDDETIGSGWGGDEVTINGYGDNVSINGSVVLGTDGLNVNISWANNTVTDASGVTGGTVNMLSDGNSADISDGDVTFGGDSIYTNVGGSGNVVSSNYDNDGAYVSGSGDTAELSNGWINLSSGDQSVTMDGSDDWLGTNGYADDAATIAGQVQTDLTNGSVLLNTGAEVDLDDGGNTVSDADGASGGIVGIDSSGNTVNVSDGSVQFNGNDLSTTVDGSDEAVGSGWTGDEVTLNGDGDNVSINGSVVLGSDNLNVNISWANNTVTDASGVTGGTVNMLSDGNSADISDGDVSFGGDNIYTNVGGTGNTVSSSYDNDGAYVSGSGDTADFSNGWINLTNGGQSVIMDGSNDWLGTNGYSGDEATVAGQVQTDLTDGSVLLDTGAEVDLDDGGNTVSDASGPSGGTVGVYSSGNTVDVSDGYVAFDGNDLSTTVDGNDENIGGGWTGDEVTVNGNGDTAFINGSIVLGSDNLNLNVSYANNTVTDASGVTGGTVDMLSDGNTADISDGDVTFGGDNIYTNVGGSGNVISSSDSNDGAYVSGSGDTAEFSNGWINLANGGQSVIMDGSNNWLGTNGYSGDSATISGLVQTDLTNGSVALDAGSEVDLDDGGNTVTDASGVTGGTVGLYNSGNTVDVSDGDVTVDGNYLSTTVNGSDETIGSGWTGDEVTINGNGDNVSVNGSVVLGSDDLSVNISYSNNTVTDASGITGGSIDMLGSGNTADISDGSISVGDDISTTIGGSDDSVVASGSDDSIYFDGTSETAQISNGTVSVGVGGQSVAVYGAGNSIVGNDATADIDGLAYIDLTNSSVTATSDAEVDLYGVGTTASEAAGLTGGTFGVLSDGDTVNVSGGNVWFGADDLSTDVSGNNDNIYTGWTGDAFDVAGTEDSISANGGEVYLEGDGGITQTVTANDATVDVASGVDVEVYGNDDTFIGGGGLIESMGDGNDFESDDSVDLANTDDDDDTSDNDGSVTDIADGYFDGFPGGGYYGGYGGYGGYGYGGYGYGGYGGGYGGYGFAAGKAPKGADIGSIASLDVKGGKQSEAITAEAAKLQAISAASTTSAASLSSAAFEGPKWSSKTITWSLATPAGMLPSAVAQYQAAVEQAFATWSQASGITFQEVSTPQAADIKIGWRDFNTSQTGVLGYTGLNAASGTISGAAISLENPTEDVLQTDANGQLAYSGTGTELQQLLLHEIGHALGLADSSDPDSIMAPSLSSANLSLDDTDTAGIQALYGSTNDLASAGAHSNWSDLEAQSAQLIDAMARFTSGSSPALTSNPVANNDNNVSTLLAASH